MKKNSVYRLLRLENFNERLAHYCTDVQIDDPRFVVIAYALWAILNEKYDIAEADIDYLLEYYS